MNKIDELLMNEKVEWKKLGEVCEIKNGYAFKSSLYSTRGIRIIRISDVQNGYLSDKNIKYYPISTKEEISKFLLKEKDLVVSLTGNVGRVAEINTDVLPAGLNQRVACLRAGDPIMARYLYHYLNQNQFEKLAIQNASGEGQKNLSTSWLSMYIIPIPSIETQEKIVKTLDKFTNYVTELQAELQARTKQYEYYRDFLLSEKYLNKLSEQIYDFTKEKYELKITTLGDIAKVNRGASPRPISKYITDDDTGIPWIKIGDIGLNSKYVTKTKQKITVEGSKNSRVLNKGDFIMSNSMSYGRPYILDIVGAIHDGWASISDFDKFLDSDFLYYYLTTTKVQNYWNNKINSSSVSNLNSEIIRSLPIPLVDKRLQKNIVIILDKFQLLLSDTKGLLPKEIEQRQKQYEYYREKLLTFDVECGSKQASKS